MKQVKIFLIFLAEIVYKINFLMSVFKANNAMPVDISDSHFMNNEAI